MIYFYFNKMTYISLGGNCAVCYNLRQLNLYNESMPFDYCKVSIKKLINVLDNNFINYKDIEFKKKSNNHKIIKSNNLTEDNSIILTNKYNIQFAHEISNKYNINEFKEKLQTRIKRFINIENPIFVRLETENIKDMNIYYKLEEVLDKYFKNYKIILISKKKIKSNKIIHYSLDEFSSDWKYESVNWNNIFT